MEEWLDERMERRSEGGERRCAYFLSVFLYIGSTKWGVEGIDCILVLVVECLFLFCFSFCVSVVSCQFLVLSCCVSFSNHKKSLVFFVFAGLYVCMRSRKP